MCVCVCVEGRAYLSSNDDQRAFDSNLLQLGRPNLRFLDQSVVVSSAQSTISGEHDQSDLLHWADGNQGAVNILVCDSEVDAVQNLFSHSVKMRKKRESITTAPSLFIRHIYIYMQVESQTLTRFSENGRPPTTASCARRTFAAATSFIASVIF